VGWGDPSVVVSLVGGLALLGAFLLHERRAAAPMLPLELFRSRNFAVGNLTTFAMYAGLSAATFFLPVYLQQVAGYRAVKAGLSLLPITVLMFFLAKRAGALADRYGPRLFMGVGPLVAAGGIALFQRVGPNAGYLSELLPGMLVFGLGLVLTVAPLTATVLAAVDAHHAGVASGTNNAIARVAGLIAIAALGAVVAARFVAAVDERAARERLPAAAQSALAHARDRPLVVATPAGLPAPERAQVRDVLSGASVDAFHLGMAVAAVLVASGGLVALVGIENPRRRVPAADCPGGAFAGASRHAVEPGVQAAS
jgi:predicted MFS family arabinose efflux permease